MAERDVAETVADGDQLNEGYFNGNIVNRKLFAKATQFDSTSGTFEDITSGSFTLTNALNGLVIGVYVEGEVQSSNGGDDAIVSLKVSGTNLGTLYFNSAKLYSGTTIDGGIAVQASETGLLRSSVASFTVHATSVTAGLKLLDATTTFQFRIKRDAAATASVKNLVCRVVFVRGFNEE